MGWIEDRLDRNSDQRLCGTLGIGDLDELQKDKIIIPPVVFEKARADLDLTLADFRERLAYFDIKGGQIKIGRQEIGLPAEIKNGEIIGGEINTSPQRALYELFIARPIPILLHTHCFYTEVSGIEKDTKDLYEGLPPEQWLFLINAFTDYFSEDDLEIIETRSRFIRSALLASPGGYTWVIDPNQGSFVNLLDNECYFYGRDMDQSVQWAKKNVVEGRSDLVNTERLDSMLLGKLYTFCESTGCVGFYNRDRNNPELTTLRLL